MNSKAVIRCLILINKIYNWKLQKKKEINLSPEELKVSKSVHITWLRTKNIMTKSVEIEWIK